jgi:hypothetical protein
MAKASRTIWMGGLLAALIGLAGGAPGLAVAGPSRQAADGAIPGVQEFPGVIAAHQSGPIDYAEIPPPGGAHAPIWVNCGVYGEPVPTEMAVHALEHGAVWITYQPSLPQSEVDQLRAFAAKQTVLPSTEGAPSRYMDLTPYPGLTSPIVISSWGFQLKVGSPADPRLQQFVNTFRASPKYTPEYGGACTGGLGTPLQK